MFWPNPLQLPLLTSPRSIPPLYSVPLFCVFIFNKTVISYQHQFELSIKFWMCSHLLEIWCLLRATPSRKTDFTSSQSHLHSSSSIRSGCLLATQGLTSVFEVYFLCYLVRFTICIRNRCRYHTQRVLHKFTEIKFKINLCCKSWLRASGVCLYSSTYLGSRRRRSSVSQANMA